MKSLNSKMDQNKHKPKLTNKKPRKKLDEVRLFRRRPVLVEGRINKYGRLLVKGKGFPEIRINKRMILTLAAEQGTVYYYDHGGTFLLITNYNPK